jgi:hypothetical protein
MEEKEAVDKVLAEIEKVITKFTAINEHSSKLIANEISTLNNIKNNIFQENGKLD